MAQICAIAAAPPLKESLDFLSCVRLASTEVVSLLGVRNVSSAAHISRTEKYSVDCMRRAFDANIRVAEAMRQAVRHNKNEPHGGGDGALSPHW